MSSAACVDCGFLASSNFATLSSPFTSLLSTNAPVTGFEERDIREFVARLTAERRGRYERITLLKSLVKQLQIEQRKADDLIQQHRSLVCPIRRTPVELWQQIFGYCAEDDSDKLAKLQSSLAPHAFPWSVSQVCREWRNIALITSEVWSSIRICFDEFKNHSPSFFHRRLLAQLARSNDRLLSVSVMAGKEASPDLFTQRLLYDALMAHSRRITFMSLHDEDNLHSLAPSFYNPVLLDQFPILSRLELRISAAETVESFHASPALNHVIITFTNTFRFNGPVLIQLPWTQLTTCEIYNIPVFAAPGILTQLYNAHTLSLSTVDLAPIQLPTDIDTLAFPVLEKLDIDLHPRTVSWFLSRFRFDELRSLKASISTALEHTLVECIHRSACSIERLFITDIRSDSQLHRMIDLLQVVPCLKELTLEMAENVDVSIISDVLGTMSSESPPAPICPRLNVITLNGAPRYGSVVEGGQFITMIERIVAAFDDKSLQQNLQASRTRLRTIRVRGYDGWKEEWLTRLRELKASNGLNLTVSGRTDDKNPWQERRELLSATDLAFDRGLAGCWAEHRARIWSTVEWQL